MHHFTPVRALVGGVLLGIATCWLWLGTGRIAGISAILGDVFSRRVADRGWRALFLAGLLAGGLVLGTVWPSAFGASPRPLAVIAIAGLLVGFGARMGGGCTSGHGICGLSRLSLRSLVATVAFIAAGMLTVLATRGMGTP
jgi:uncharacterized protein